VAQNFASVEATWFFWYV